MDNVTHTLISILVGEAVHRSVPPSAVLGDRARRGAAIAVMAVGGNLPDADVIYTGWAGTTTDYLLHHRGHTHTVVGALGLAVLLFVAVRLWWRYRRITPRRADLLFLAGLAVLAPLLHIGLDFTNSYGVHPFWPLDNRWFYGDAVFIVEPLLWACAAALLFVLPGRTPRVLIGLVLAAGLGLSWFTGFVPASFAVLLTLLTAGLAALSRFASARVALAGGVAAWLVLTATFAVTSRSAERRVEALLAERFPAARTLDVVLTPMPADPVCREVIAVQRTADRYVLRRAFDSLAPGWIPAERCARLYPSGDETTAPLAPVDQPSTGEIAWRGELSLDAGLFATLAGQSCAVEALLRFARAPWAAPAGDGWIVGDLRYDREAGAGLAEVRTGPGGDGCPRLPAPWTPPRQELLPGE
ncbi:metal-dependent hydrolase [Dactylosporangium aurantiacum]|uniref:Metal-dependent hydrolase n=1 Tax=Dactylosporangium aurantiacum TaxID=35754 RepID=A0A9Q9MA18_9ACTN|nr:metal-dependent hydrolase [Dactylosporangium aurantiacum]MDG6110087.1 metal-dependent hydrolase [Dactylosporangium aurantiacum]UWZ51338.1 metal-dependent hydrolase [Dactylosporangium aurantiacum]